MATIIVSPTARDAVRITDAAIPDMAEGNTTRKIVGSRAAPSA